MALHPVATPGEIAPGSRKLVTIGKLTLGIFNLNGVLYAYRNVCPHAGAPVCRGSISGTSLPSPVYEYHYGREGCILRCPWHGWEFDLKTGAHLVDPNTRLKSLPLVSDADASQEALESFPLEQREGRIYVQLPSEVTPPSLS